VCKLEFWTLKIKIYQPCTPIESNIYIVKILDKKIDQLLVYSINFVSPHRICSVVNPFLSTLITNFMGILISPWKLQGNIELVSDYNGTKYENNTTYHSVVVMIVLQFHLYIYIYIYICIYIYISSLNSYLKSVQSCNW